jgi:predicted CopG family antitoxin
LLEAFEWLSEVIQSRAKHNTEVTENAKIPNQDEEVIAIIKNGMGQKLGRQ